MDVLISDEQDKIAVDAAALEQAAATILSEMRCGANCEVSIALVDDDHIRRLNREYRGIDQSTDVLSFALQEAETPPLIASPSDFPSCPVMLGDVILSPETAHRQAQEHHHSFERELYFLLIHGILHLLGYDHHTDEDARIMEKLQQRLLQKLIV